MAVHAISTLSLARGNVCAIFASRANTVNFVRELSLQIVNVVFTVTLPRSCDEAFHLDDTQMGPTPIDLDGTGSLPPLFVW